MMRIDSSIDSPRGVGHASDDDAPRRVVLSQRPRDLRLSLVRDATRLPWRCDLLAGHDELSLSEIVDRARAVNGQDGAFLIGGGEPLRRADVWDLLADLGRLRPAHLGVCTSGHGVNVSLVQRLRAVGVQRLHVPFHCARQDAHDWLVGRAGALKAARRAIRACLEADLPVAADIVLTRATLVHVPETVEVLARIGVRTVCVRRLTAADTDAPTFVSLSPRLSLLEDAVEQAAAVALRRRVRLVLRDLPWCAAPRLRPLFAAPESEGWVMPDGSVRGRVAAGLGCATCPGLPRCAGAPPDYVARFGWEELAHPDAAAVRVHESVKEQQADGASMPMSFTWRAAPRVGCRACADSVPDDAGAPPPHEATRIVRARLVEAARYRPSVLRLVGADLLAHPQAVSLIHDTLRLFRRVQVAAEASTVAAWSDLDLRRLKGLQRIDVALYGPDAARHDAHCGIPGAFAAMQRAVERVRTQTDIAVGAYAILHDTDCLPDFVDAWTHGRLPGTPRFRLSASGASLDALIAYVRTLPPGAARAALVDVLPRCACAPDTLVDTNSGADATATRDDALQQSIHCGRSVPYQPCGSDPIGAFETCPEGRESCALSGCPGTAVGWQRAARSVRWTMSL